MNKIMLIGNVGKDPEGKYTPRGTAITRFPLAVTRTFTTVSGEAKEETEWFTILTWRKLAEICNHYLEKGKKVYIEGRLTQRKYTDRDGIQRIAVEVIASEMEMLSAKQMTRKQSDEDSDEEIEALLAELEQQNDTSNSPL